MIQLVFNMTDPLSVTASVIAVATLTYRSCKTLNDLVSSFKNAPRTIKDLQGDLYTLQGLLNSLKDGLGGIQQQGGRGLTTNQQECFKELKPALEGCKACCDNFTQQLSQMTSPPDTDRVNWWDRARLHFNEKDISLLKSQLGDYKQTLEIGLSVTIIKQMSRNRDALQEMETKIATTMSGFSGQIKGLETALQTLTLQSMSISQSDVDKVVAVLSDHDRILKQCLRVCTSALTETTALTGTQVKYARTFEEARQFVGNIGTVGAGGPATKVEHGEARGKSRQVIGNVDGDFAREFLC